MTDKHKIENGERITMIIDGETVLAGFNIVLGVPQLAYVPKTNRQPPVGVMLAIGDTVYEVIVSRRSTFMPRMVVLEMKEIVDAAAS